MTTHVDYAIIAPEQATGDAVPIECFGAADVETMALPADRDWISTNGWSPDYTRSGDEWCASYYDAAEREIKPRPRVTAPPSGGGAPLTMPLSDYPDGCSVTLRNEAEDEMVVETPGKDVTLSDPGWYQIEIAPPFPWLPLKMEIDVA